MNFGELRQKWHSSFLLNFIKRRKVNDLSDMR